MHRVFRPRTVRWAGYGIGVTVLAASIAMAVLVPGFDLGNRLLFVVFGLVIAWFCHREASVRVVAERDRIIVRNLLRTWQLDWPQVIGVSFPAGDPWAHLDLSSGRTLPVMAFQRTDGARGLQLAREFAELVRIHGEGREPGRGEG